MNPEPLPPDFLELEGQLARRRCDEPSADFRGRVLGAVRGALAPPVPGRRRWPLVWRVAAVALLALNVGLSIDNGVRFRRLVPQATRGGPGRPVGDPAEADGRFHRLADRARANVPPAPDAGSLGRHLFSNEEERGWDMP